MVRRCWVLLLLLFVSSVCFGQMSKPWLIYYGITHFKNSKVGIYHEAQIQDHILVGLRYTIIPNLLSTVSFGRVHSNIIGTSEMPYNENQIVQELSYGQSVKNVSIKHRARIEERFIEDKGFNVRGRYYVGVDIPMSSKGFDKNAFYIALYDEVFANITPSTTGRILERNRIYAGIGFKMTKDIGWQLGMMNQKIVKNKMANQILVSLHHKINW